MPSTILGRNPTKRDNEIASHQISLPLSAYRAHERSPPSKPSSARYHPLVIHLITLFSPTNNFYITPTNNLFHPTAHKYFSSFLHKSFYFLFHTWKLIRLCISLYLHALFLFFLLIIYFFVVLLKTFVFLWIEFRCHDGSGLAKRWFGGGVAIR